MFKKRLLVIIYISIVLFAFAQEKKGSLGSQPPSDKKPDAAAVEESWKDKSRAFLTNSIANDIAQSNFSQLKAMAKAVGLKDYDNDAQYRKALYDYYGITNPHTVTTKKQGNKIILEEAGELRMHSFKNDDEEYLHFFGKVKIKIDDKDENNATVTKIIQADEIYIDLKNKEISGFGNVYFKDNKLEFNGNQLFYNFKVGRGVLFNGTTKISQAGKSGLDGMIFKGDKIVQTDKQDNMLVNGELTTCDAANPHYSIRVKKVWINQEEEWGIMGAVYNVGSIPFLYIPIYYHPKGIKINPVLGYRSREGWYFNSTYYILGEQSEVKRDSTDTFGVDANRADPSGEKATIQITNAKITEKLNMFYDSHEFYKKHPKMRFVPKDFQSMNLALRVWGDAYTNLGFYGGGFFYMNINHKNFPIKIKLLSDFAASRLIWKNSTTGQYLPYKPADYAEGNPGWDLKNTYLFPSNNPLTFRTSQYLYLEGKLMPNYVNFSYSGQIEYVSDYDYYRDFYSRSRYFSYIDLMFDAIKYAMEQGESDTSAFSTSEDKKASSKSDINTYLKFSFSPKEYKDIFGLKPINSVSLTAESKVVMKKTTFNKFTYESSTLEDPDYYKFILSNFYAPTATFKMSGEILNYKTFVDMPNKYRTYLNKKNTPMSLDEQAEKELFEQLNTVAAADVSKDTTALDVMDVLPVFSKPLKTIYKKSADLVKSDLYSRPTYNGIDYAAAKKKDKKEETKTSNIKSQEDYRQLYIPASVKSASASSTGIEIVNFNLSYDFNDSLSNQFIFHNDATYDWNEDDNYRDAKLDTVERLAAGEFEMNKYLERFNINNTLTYTMKGDFSLLAFTSSSKLLQMNPNFVVTYKKNWDDIDIYKRYLYRTTAGTGDALESAIRKSIISREVSNRNASETTVYYTDTVKNDLSFGSKLMAGTGISTYMKFKLFKYNEQTGHYYDKLNDLNEGSDGYEPVDSLFYDNRCAYEKIDSLYTNITLKFNIFDGTTSPHTLNISAGPKINWSIPTTYINEMKSDIWNDYLYDTTTYVRYSDTSDPEIAGTELLSTLKDYIYYRKNASKLNKKINEFFQQENFFSGTKNYRKMLENISINLNYGFKYNDINVVTAANTFSIVFENIGEFSARDESTDSQYANAIKAPFAFYPNDTLSLTFFNSMFTYSFSNTFNKELDKNYKNLVSERQKLDEYKIVYMTQSHTFNFTLKESLFPVKLGGDWMSFTSRTTFKWNKNVRWYNNPTHDNDLYLESQALDLKILKNILQMGISFKYLSYKVPGADMGRYGFELDKGYFAISYNVTEIPVFLRYFKLTINPVIRYDFMARHEDYYASSSSSTVTAINSDYYSNNKLSFYLGLDLTIGAGTQFETKIHFHTKSANNKMYKYYTKTGWEDFWDDLGASFNFADISERKRSNFNLQEINVTVSHSIHDWDVTFSYLGQPQKTSDSDGKNATNYWENTFTFAVKWKFNSSNQLMNMFKKTDLEDKYEKGEWQARNLSLQAE